MKKIKNRYISAFLLCAVMLVAVFSPYTVFAADGIGASATDDFGKAGDTVTTAVNIDKNVGVVAISISVEYDSEALTLVSANKGAIFADMSYSPDEDLAIQPYSMTWADFNVDDIDVENMSEEELLILTIQIIEGMEPDPATGKLAEFQFKVNDGAKSGEYEVSYIINTVYSMDIMSDTTDGETVEIYSIITVTDTEEMTEEETTEEETTEEETTEEETTEEETTEEETTEEITTEEETTEEVTTEEATKPAEDTHDGGSAEPDEPALAMPSFIDVKPSDWFYDYVGYVASHGLIKGISDTEFQPYTPTTRAMFVTILGRMSGIDVEYYSGDSGFSDVAVNMWYSSYVKWAAQSVVVLGYDDGKFYPDAIITREQMCVMLVRYIQYIGRSITPTINTFADSMDISDWAYDAVSVAASYGLVTGRGENRFDPKAEANRAEIAVIIKRFKETF